MCSDLGTSLWHNQKKKQVVAGRKVELQADKLMAARALHKYASPQCSISSSVYLKGGSVFFTVLKIISFPFLKTLV